MDCSWFDEPPSNKLKDARFKCTLVFALFSFTACKTRNIQQSYFRQPTILKDIHIHFTDKKVVIGLKRIKAGKTL